MNKLYFFAQRKIYPTYAFTSKDFKKYFINK